MQLNKDSNLNGLHRAWLNKRGISDETIDAFSISTGSLPAPHNSDAIVIPINDEHGRFSFNKYRRDPLDERKPKYLYDKGGRITLYGADKLDDAVDTEATDIIVITEGELDTLVCWSQNIPAVSSTGGAMSFQEDWAGLLAGYEVYVCFDNDQTGAAGTVKVVDKFAQANLPPPKVIHIPKQTGVKDISDFVARGGDFHALMRSARSYAGVEDVQEDMEARGAQWLPVDFHEAYLDFYREKEERETRSHEPNNYAGDDAVLRAKAYPCSNLLDFRQNKHSCLWHNEKTPSLHYYRKTNSCYCHGSCAKRFDSIDIYMHLNGVGFMEAVEAINKLS